MENTGRANGMYFEADGNLITCADMKGELRSIDKEGNSTVLVNNYQGKRLNGPNDLWIAPNGALYVTDPLYKREYWTKEDLKKIESQQHGKHVYYLSPDRKTFIAVDENLVQPNGIVGTPDGKHLFVADIDDSKVYKYDIQPDGSLTNRVKFCSMKSDGMTIDSQGNLYLTNELGVTAFNPAGERIFNIPTGENWTANVVFGGTDRKLLFITAMGNVYGLTMNVGGVK
jgi:gluconolactonase